MWQHAQAVIINFCERLLKPKILVKFRHWLKARDSNTRLRQNRLELYLSKALYVQSKIEAI